MSIAFILLLLLVKNIGVPHPRNLQKFESGPSTTLNPHEISNFFRMRQSAKFNPRNV